MLDVRARWARWREKRRQYATERALDKAERAKEANEHPPTIPYEPPLPGGGGSGP